MQSITLNPGDLVMWVDGERTAPMVVADDGESLWFQFAPRPWHELEHGLDRNHRGLTVKEAEEVLNGEALFPGSGYLFKSYDEASGSSLPDPELGLA